MIQLSMMSAMRFPEILNGEMPLAVAVTRCSVIFVLVQVDGFGVLEVVREVSHQEHVLSQPAAAYFFLGLLQCWGIVKRA